MAAKQTEEYGRHFSTASFLHPCEAGCRLLSLQRKQACGFLAVALQLGGKFGKVLEFAFPTDMGKQGDADVLAVYFTVEIKDIDLNAGLAGTADSGARADVQHAAVALPADKYLHGINSRNRQELPDIVQSNVGCGESHVAPDFVASHDFPPQGIGIAQELVHAGNVAPLQGIADFRGTDVDFVFFVDFFLLQVKMIGGSQGFQLFKSAFTVFPEAMVIANDQPLHANLPDQQVAHKVCVFEVCQ